uniref:Uncharacterized protein n=1 Tax=Anguilla anguilla TaxID=7936 RepID=A0A0E9W3B5_ANGAN
MSTQKKRLRILV